VCTLLLEQIPIVFVYWTSEEAAPYFSELAAVVDAGLHSGSEIARRAARDAVEALTTLWYVLSPPIPAAICFMRLIHSVGVLMQAESYQRAAGYPATTTDSVGS
jgi:hypothetical protein